MNVVLIDVAGNLARIHKVYPGLAKRFEYVGKMGPEEVVYAAPEGDDRPVRPVQPRKAEEAAVPRKVRRQTEEPAVNKVQPVPEPAAPGASQNRSRIRGRTRSINQKQGRNQSRCAKKWRRPARIRLSARKNLKRYL